MGRNGRGVRRPLGAWLFVYALFALCAVLGILQYRAITELSIAAHERLRSSLEASLFAVSQDFNSEISTAAGALLPASPESAQAAQSAFVTLYQRGRQTALYRQLFPRIAMAVRGKAGVDLAAFDPDRGGWKPMNWPAEWIPLRTRMESSPQFGPPERNGGPAFEIPLFRPAPPGPPGPRHEVGWLIFEVSVPYVRDNLLPEIMQRHLGADYQAEVVTRTTPREVVYRSDPETGSNLEQTADASVSLFDPQMEAMLHRQGPPMRGRGGGGRGGGGRGPSPEMGRWLLFVRHRAGSLEAAVAQARWRSLAVTAGVLLMLAATLGALIRYTRRAQKLAELQMDFVAGVSHELRTPLTVIHTAAHNLRGKVAANPAQVERYGTLIQQESGRLKELLEQVLRFAGANAGKVIQEREPLAVEALLDEVILASRPATENAGCVVEKRVAADLPAVLGDPVALRQALQNLLSNAAKYGSGESRWIGVTAAKAGSAGRPAVEIRVADRGRGIPEEEQKHIFDPFFRGVRAVQDQVHGTGLGLSLVKRIVEAHGGSVAVKSAPMKGAEFVVRLPAMAEEEGVELAAEPGRERKSAFPGPGETP